MVNKVPLGKLLIEQKERTGTEHAGGLPLLGVNNKVGLHRSTGNKIKDLSNYKIVQRDWFAYNPMRINVGSLGLALTDEQVGVVSPDYVVFSCGENLSSHYLYRFLKSPTGMINIRKNTTGTVRERLYFKSLAKIEIPLPSIIEQIDISNKLKSTESILQQTIDKNTNQLDTVAKLRQAILQLAVQGKLVPQDPKDEPASVLLEKIQADKQRLLAKRKVKLRKVSERDDIKKLKYEIPEEWCWCLLKDVAFFQEGPGIRNWQFRQEGIKLLNVSNILKNGSLDFENSDKFISKKEYNEKYKHFLIEDGDLLFASSGGSWGKFSWYKDQGYKVILNTSTIRLKFYSSLFEPNYLYHFLSTFFFKKQMRMQQVGMQPNFGSTHLSRVYIPVPPLNEQKHIVAKVEELMALCDQLEISLSQSQTDCDRLMGAVVAEVLAA